MKVNVSWDNDKKNVIRFEYEPMWTWEDFRWASDISDEMMESVDHIVELIIYFRDGVTLPPSAVKNFKEALERAPKNSGMVVVVGGNMLTDMVLANVTKVFKSLSNRLIVANSLEEARVRIIEAQRKRA